MASRAQQSSKKPVNLNDQFSLKRALDDAACELILSKGYTENVAVSNIKMAIGLITTGLALFAQFYPKKFPANRDLLIICIILYVIFHIFLQLVLHLKEKDNFLFTHPLQGSFDSTGLAVSSKFPNHSDLYHLKISSSDPKSKTAKPSVELVKTVTQWFTKDGFLLEEAFSEDVEKLLADYHKESRKAK